MATYTCVVSSLDPYMEMNSSGILLLGLTATFFENDGGAIDPRPASVAVEWNPSSALSTLNDAITDALVDYADVNFGWTLPRTRCVFPSFQKGLII